MNDEERYADYLEGGTLDGTLDEGARAELDELRRLFASPNTWDEPPPGLADDIVAGIRAAGAVTPEPAPHASGAPASGADARRSSARPPPCWCSPSPSEPCS